MLTSSNHELEELCIGDDRVKRYKDRVEELNDDPEYTILMSDEEDDKKLKATRDYLWNLKLKELDEKTQQLDDKAQQLDDKEQELDKEKEELDRLKQELLDKISKLNNK